MGVGRAGSVRMRDLQGPHASSAFLNLIGFVSRWLTLTFYLVIHGEPSGMETALDTEILMTQERESAPELFPKTLHRVSPTDLKFG